MRLRALFGLFCFLESGVVTAETVALDLGVWLPKIGAPVLPNMQLRWLEFLFPGKAAMAPLPIFVCVSFGFFAS